MRVVFCERSERFRNECSSMLEALWAMPWYTLPIGLSNLLAKLSSVDGDLRNGLSVLAVWLTLVGQQASKEIYKVCKMP